MPAGGKVAVTGPDGSGASTLLGVVTGLLPHYGGTVQVAGITLRDVDPTTMRDRVGLVFGVVEAITPVLGWLLGTATSRFIEEWDHWIAFGLLAALGLHMIWQALRLDGEDDKADDDHGNLFKLAVAGLATSIDAMAVGVGLAFADVPIGLVAVVLIGLLLIAGSSDSSDSMGNPLSP